MAERSSGWCVVSEPEYRTLVGHLGGDGLEVSGSDESARAVLEQLWDAGLLLAGDRPNPDCVRPRSKLPASILLKLTGACNFSCTYCYDYDEERFQARLELDRVKDTLRYLLENREELGITFHGGEPLLRFDLLRQIVEFAEDEAGDPKRLRLAIQTNGSLFTRETVSFLDSHSFSVGISLDGLDEAANALRLVHGPRSALESVRDLIRRYPGFVHQRCGFLAVVSKTSLPGVPDFALWLQELGVSGFSISFLDLEGRGEREKHEKPSPDDAVQLYRTLIAMVRRRELWDLGFNTLVSRIDNLFTFQPRDFCFKGPCGASGDFLVLDAEGRFRTCDCIYDEYFEMGDATTPLAELLDHSARKSVVDRHEWLLVEGPSCSACPLFGVCGGTCVAKAIANHATPLSVDPTECAMARYLYPELLQDFASGSPTLFDYYRKHRPTEH